MPTVRSPPISPEKPRRPGRGSSPGRCSSALAAGTAAGTAALHASEEEGRLGSGPIMHARLRSMGDGVDFLGGSGGGGMLVGGGGISRGISSSGGAGRTDSEASMSRSTSSGAAPGAGGGGGPDGVRKAAPTPVLPPVVRDLLGAMDHGGARGAAGMGVFPTGDTPPPTVRPLELRRSVSAQGGAWGIGGASRRPALTLQQRSKEDGGGGGKGGDIWQVEGGMSDARRGASGDGGSGGGNGGPGSPRIAEEEGSPRIAEEGGSPPIAEEGGE